MSILIGVPKNPIKILWFDTFEAKSCNGGVIINFIVHKLTSLFIINDLETNNFFSFRFAEFEIALTYAVTYKIQVQKMAISQDI